MRPRDRKALLLDVVDACERIERYTDGLEYPDYQRDEKLRDAVERRLFIIGEAVNRLRQLEPLEVHTLGDVLGIVDVRNILAHSYFSVQHDLIWDIAKVHVPRLLLAAREWADSIE